jgi:hypothetical protein
VKTVMIDLNDNWQKIKKFGGVKIKKVPQSAELLNTREESVNILAGESRQVVNR